MPVIAHGVDLVDIARVEAMLDEHGRRFVQRCFTDGEQRYADAGRRHRAQRYAARFACKEAVLKALGPSAPWPASSPAATASPGRA
ncbi:MAG: holo-ACP synthase [Planctomycetota bacterium]